MLQMFGTQSIDALKKVTSIIIISLHRTDILLKTFIIGAVFLWTLKNGTLQIRPLFLGNSNYYKGHSYTSFKMPPVAAPLCTTLNVTKDLSNNYSQAMLKTSWHFIYPFIPNLHEMKILRKDAIVISYLISKRKSLESDLGVLVFTRIFTEPDRHK